MKSAYFDDKVVVKINEYYVTGHGWMTAMERKNLLDSLLRTDFAAYQKVWRGTEYLNVHYMQLQKFPDGEMAVHRGNADISYVEYRELNTRGFYVRRDTGEFYESGRPMRDFVTYVYLQGTDRSLRAAHQIMRLVIGEENGKLFFSNN